MNEQAPAGPGAWLRRGQDVGAARDSRLCSIDEHVVVIALQHGAQNVLEVFLDIDALRRGYHARLAQQPGRQLRPGPLVRAGRAGLLLLFHASLQQARVGGGAAASPRRWPGPREESARDSGCRWHWLGRPRW